MGRDDPQQGQGTPRDFRLLVVATSSNISEPVRREIDRRAAGRPTKTMVVVPALAGSRFEQAAGAVDEAIAHADEQREPAAEEAREAGVQLVTEPRIGDSDPILAIEDALREFPAEEILIVTRPAEDAAWMEEDLFDRARERFSQPIAHFVLDTETTRSLMRIAPRLDMKPREAPKLEIAQRTCRRSRPAICSASGSLPSARRSSSCWPHPAAIFRRTRACRAAV